MIFMQEDGVSLVAHVGAPVTVEHDGAEVCIELPIDVEILEVASDG
ncbi:hypothetical protein [Streptomyces sp. 130]|nr:hypothetical protein [Streptomyces sp. 130]